MSTTNDLARELEAMEDQRDAVDALLASVLRANEETYPWSLCTALSNGENPIRVWREFRQMTAVELARACSIDEARLAALEAGECEPSLRVAASIARALRIDVDDLLPPDQG